MKAIYLRKRVFETNINFEYRVNKQLAEIQENSKYSITGVNIYNNSVIIYYTEGIEDLTKSENLKIIKGFHV